MRRFGDEETEKVFNAACALVLRVNTGLIQPGELLEDAQAGGISEDDLEWIWKGLIGSRALRPYERGDDSIAVIDTGAMEQYLTTHYPDYSSVKARVAQEILNGSEQAGEIVTTLQVPHMLVIHVVKLFKSLGLIGLEDVGAMDCDDYILSPNPLRLKRFVQDGGNRAA